MSWKANPIATAPIPSPASRLAKVRSGITTIAAMNRPMIQMASLTSVSISVLRLVRNSVRPTITSEMRAAKRAMIQVRKTMKTAIARVGRASTKP